MFAGVYNEYIIKHVAGDKVDIMLQNAYMYIDSIFCNLILIFGYNFFSHQDTGGLYPGDTIFDLMSLLQGFVIAIALNNALIGIVTSLFLKIFNSILKSFASAMELVFTAILSFLILGIPIYWNTVFSVAIVSSAVIMYAQNPIRNSNVDKSSPKKEASSNNSKV